MTLNLGALAALAADSDKPQRMTVIDPDTQKPLKDDDGKECWIEFISVDSEVGRRLERERTGAQLRKMRSGRNRQDDEDFVEQQVEALTALATGWWFGGSPFSKDAAGELFAHRQYAWLRKQAWGFVNNEANFMMGSSKNSSATPSTNSASTES